MSPSLSNDGVEISENPRSRSTTACTLSLSTPAQLALNVPTMALNEFKYPRLARTDLPDDVAYRLAKALHKGNDAFARRLDQARETTPQNTRLAAPSTDRIHPGVQRYLKEIGL